jgi:hypothetical protein
MGMNPAIDRFTAIINPPQAGPLEFWLLVLLRRSSFRVPGKDGGIEWDELKKVVET